MSQPKNLKLNLYGRLLQKLSRREMTDFEALKFVKDKGLSESESRELIEELKEDNYLNNDRFLEALIRTGIRKGWGPRKVLWKARDKGLQPKASEIRSGLYEEGSKWVFDVLQKRFPDWRDAQSDLKKRQAMMRFMESRGFDWSDMERLFSKDPLV